MKKSFVSFLALSVFAALCLPAAAEEEVVYGTMQIPFADFYAAEGVAYEVDAVSSCTETKWFSDSLATGGYSAAHEGDNGGDILGVVYPVAISAADLEALGEDNYGFEALEEAPASYKEVTVAEDGVSFSAVVGETTPIDATAVLTTRTVWGDYEIDIDALNNADGTSDIGPLDGCFLTTEDGSVYAMRQLENIWRDELSWSSGIRVTEPHGNDMSFENFADLMGKTITSITYITDSGYHVLDTELYVPVKFVCEALIEDTPAADGSAALSLTGFPEDYDLSYAVTAGDLAGEVADGVLSFTDALAGAYTLTISDAQGKYADVDVPFVLTTEDLPVAYENGSLVAAEGFDEKAAAAFIANISTVSVNGEEYAASGRGSVAIIDMDGEVDPEAAMVHGRGPDAETTPIFAEAGDYELVVSATGYANSLSFTFTVE